MSGFQNDQDAPVPIVACTVTSDINKYELLIDEMEVEFNEGWGDLTFVECMGYLSQPDSSSLRNLVIAIGPEDEANLPVIANIISHASANNIKTLIVATNISPATLHQILKLGASEFLPYPLPPNSLHETIERINAPQPENVVQLPAQDPREATLKATGDREGAIFAVQGLSGGSGASTLAVNLAWELTQNQTDGKKKKNEPTQPAPRVCLLDFGLQFGSIATFLDLPRRDIVFELLSDTEMMDQDMFMQALLTYENKLQVLTAPKEILPLDIIGPDDVTRIIEIARTNFDYVIIDMPPAVIQWTETVLQAAHLCFMTLELDLRSAQNTDRMIQILRQEQLPTEKLRYVLNRAPKFTDLSGKSRAKSLADNLGISLDVQIPDGGRVVADACDQGVPVSIMNGKNALGKEVAKLATSLREVNEMPMAAQ